MNTVTALLLAAIVLAAALAIRSIRKNKASSCGGNCANCPGGCGK